MRLIHLAYRFAIRVRHVYWRLARPEVHGAKVLLFDAAGRILLIRHSYGRSDLYMLPGGGKKRGESAELAARRELAEEVRCTVRAIRPFGGYLDRTKGAFNHVHVFVAETEDQPIIDGREIIEARFFALDALPEHLSDATARRIAEYNGERVADGRW